MSAVGRLLKRDPSLTPLFGAVGLGVVGALAFAGHYLRHSPDVVIKKKQSPDPWNKVEQNQNTKLHTRNPDFWASRSDVPHPRALFHSPTEEGDQNSLPRIVPSAASQAAKEGAIRRAREKMWPEVSGKGDDGEWKERSVAH
ncbi:hypothetical protein JCM8097_001394 [Rhodosporidiobolus ruineniae]